MSRDIHSLKSTLARDVSKRQIRAQCNPLVDDGSGDNGYDPCLGNLEDKRDGLINEIVEAVLMILNRQMVTGKL